ncbi:TPA: AAA family ATPase [Pseudomonas aeruginosa]|nr:AAA family ATPase [Pseudomonas aeruginosa]
MLLWNLGFNESIADDDAVAILVGPNGSGKSIHLQKIASQYRNQRSVSVLSNTAYGRLNGLRKVNRLSVGRNGPSPKTIIKKAIAETLDREGAEFYHITSILDYCRYIPRFGFSLEGYKPGGFERFRNLITDVGRLFPSQQQLLDFESAQRVIERWPHKGLMWIDSSGPVHQFSASREFAAVLRSEPFLVKAGILKSIGVHLAKKDGSVFELKHASSGEQSLISSLVFLTTTVEHNSVVLIDEPENSLHPSWQREYVSKIIAALAYRNVSVVIATHSPLVVTGAITEHPNLVTVFEMKDGTPSRLRLNDKEKSDTGIEAVLWKAFEVVTPANHFISEEIVETINLFERNQISKNEVVSLIMKMSIKSFDSKQEDFFRAILALVDKVETRKNNLTSDGKPE